MNIGLDFDGVIFHIGALKTYAAKKLFGKSVQPEKFNREFVLDNSILTPDEYEEVRKFVYTSEDPLPFMIEVPGAIGNVKKLLDDGHNIKVITARNGTMLDVAEKWFSKFGLDLPFIGVGFGNSKYEAVRDLQVFCDDLASNLIQIKDIVPHLFLYTWDYNEKNSEKDFAKKVNSWDELYIEISLLNI